MSPLRGHLSLMALGLALALALALAAALAGCAPLPPVPGVVPAPPAGGSRPVPAPAAKPTAAVPRSMVPADSLPSRDALDVLQSIPEPLRPGEQVSPPSGSASTSATEASVADTAGADVPVPEPTLPLGERRRVTVDSTAAAPSGTPGAPGAPPASPPAAISPPAAPPSSPPPSGPTAAAADTCWRLQVLAPLAADEAERTRSTASSLLLVPMVVEHEAGRYKVRTRDCLTREAVDLLRRRAVDSGFAQAFRVSTGKR